MSELYVVTGFIVSRRSIGRNLAFAEVDIIDIAEKKKCNVTALKASQCIKVKFNRQTFLGFSSSSDERNKELAFDTYKLDGSFPTKKSSLPYGAKVKLNIGNCVKQRHPDGTNMSVNVTCMWEVLRWKILEHPKDIAERLASLSITEGSAHDSPDIVVGNGALSCSTYLKIRRQQFDKVNAIEKYGNRDAAKKSQKVKKAELAILAEEYSHGGKHAKAKRAKIFAAWVLDTFCRKHFPPMTEGICKLCTPTNQEKIELTDDNQSIQNIHVLDIAGGKGHLSLELALQQTASELEGNAEHSSITNFTIIDPMVRKGDSVMRQSKLQKFAGLNSIPVITHMATYFTPTLYKSIVEDSFQSSKAHALLLGLHPDQCTEDIVDAALQSNGSFAIVPCCVFPDLFPSREYCNEKEDLPVRTYDDFLKYLMQKDKDIQMATLPFDGKNIVLYKKVI